jgi:hypothetical protein
VISAGFESRERDELPALAMPGTAIAAMSPAKNEVGYVFIVRSVRNAIGDRCTCLRGWMSLFLVAGLNLTLELVS